MTLWSIYINPKESMKEFLKLLSLAGFQNRESTCKNQFHLYILKINIWKLKFKHNIIITSSKTKYLDLQFKDMKDLYAENYKMLRKDVKT